MTDLSQIRALADAANARGDRSACIRWHQVALALEALSDRVERLEAMFLSDDPRRALRTASIERRFHA